MVTVMIVSHRHRFIFLKTNKTAGTAIESALSLLCGSEDIITTRLPESHQHRGGLAPQNHRIDHPLKPKRPLLRRLLSILAPQVTLECMAQREPICIGCGE